MPQMTAWTARRWTVRRVNASGERSVAEAVVVVAGPEDGGAGGFPHAIDSRHTPTVATDSSRRGFSCMSLHLYDRWRRPLTAGDRLLRPVCPRVERELGAPG